MAICSFLGDLSGFPVSVILGELGLTVGKQSSLKEEFGEPPEAHLLETAVRSLDASGDYSESTPADLLGKLVVLSELRLFVKAAKVLKNLAVEEHAHTRGERGAKKPGAALEDVHNGVGELGLEISNAVNVGRDAMEALSPHLFYRGFDESGVFKLHIGIEEEKVSTGRVERAVVATHGWHAALDDVEFEQVESGGYEPGKVSGTVRRSRVGEIDRHLIHLVGLAFKRA